MWEKSEMREVEMKYETVGQQRLIERPWHANQPLF